MLPQTYTIDSQSKAQDLSSLVLSASSPSQISSAVTSVHSFLHHLSPDQSRWFFSMAFPTLIAKLFGFDDSSSSSPSSFTSSSPSPPAKASSVNGWIDTVSSSNDSDLAGKVFSLLAPNSVLLSLISAVDRLSLVKFVFPIERLPEWTRFMLSNERDSRVLADLCPLFRNRLKEDTINGSSFQVQLNVFEYYMFWFAYYPVCRGSNGNSENVSVQKSKVFRLESWASPFKGFSSDKSGSKQKIECNLYIRLFYAYLRAFVPIYDLNAHQPYRSSLLHYQSGSDGSVLIKAEFFINLLINFWLVDNDFSPVPVSVWKSLGVSFPFRSVLGEIPPISGLGEVVKVLVKYLNLSQAEVTFGSNQVEYSESPRWKASGLGSFDAMKSREVLSSSPCLQSLGTWNSLVHRPLYRFLLRTFLFCPLETSIKNVSEVFSVWMSFLEPWRISSEDFAELDAVVNRTEEDGMKMVTKSASDYSSSWQGYVLSNYLFYSSLVMHFIGFAHKFLHADAKIIVEMVAKVINILVSSGELTELLKNVDTVFHSKQAGPGKTTLHSLYRYVPSIREQLQDWENGLCESDADGSFLHDDWNKDLRLFNDGEDGGQQLLQLFILRAESELQATLNNISNNLQSVDTLKSQVNYLFGGHKKPISFTKEASPPPQSCDEMFTPRRLGNNTFADIKYKGDWMKRPISDDEVAWLAKLLIHLSAWLNQKFGLNQNTNNHTNPARSFVEVSGEAVSDVNGPIETATTAFHSLFSWLLMLGLGILGQMRKHGVRVNLRVLASKKVVMVLLMSVVFNLVKKALVGLFGRM